MFSTSGRLYKPFLSLQHICNQIPVCERSSRCAVDNRQIRLIVILEGPEER